MCSYTSWIDILKQNRKRALEQETNNHLERYVRGGRVKETNLKEMKRDLVLDSMNDAFSSFFLCLKYN